MNTATTRTMERSGARPRPSRIPGREHFRGYGITAQPFESGRVLALRVFPETDHGRFAAVWHRTPAGEWSMYVDAVRAERFRPRFFGPVLRVSARARIRVEWPRSDRLEIRMDEPALAWSVRLRESALTRLANRVLPRLPPEVYRKQATLTVVRALAHRALGLGPLDLGGTLPAGQEVLVQPRRLFMVGDARATLDGVDLGRPVRAPSTPTTGTFRWPARGVLARGDLHVKPLRRSAPPPRPKAPGR